MDRMAATNYFRIQHHGTTTRGDVFPFAHDDLAAQQAAFLAASSARGDGRVVAYRRPRFGDLEVAVVGEVRLDFSS